MDVADTESSIDLSGDEAHTGFTTDESGSDSGSDDEGMRLLSGDALALPITSQPASSMPNPQHLIKSRNTEGTLPSHRHMAPSTIITLPKPPPSAGGSALGHAGYSGQMPPSGPSSRLPPPVIPGSGPKAGLPPPVIPTTSQLPVHAERSAQLPPPVMPGATPNRSRLQIVPLPAKISTVPPLVPALAGEPIPVEPIIDVVIPVKARRGRAGKMKAATAAVAAPRTGWIEMVVAPDGESPDVQTRRLELGTYLEQAYATSSAPLTSEQIALITNMRTNMEFYSVSYGAITDTLIASMFTGM